MPSPLLVTALRDQLLRVIEWYRPAPLAFHWGAVVHRRCERGRWRFGAVTPSGESLLLSEPLLLDLDREGCWLDGAVRATVQPRLMHDGLVEAVAVAFDEDTPAEDAAAFRSMAGILTPANFPSELFLLTRRRPGGWPI